MKKNVLQKSILAIGMLFLLNACGASPLAPNNATQGGAATGAIAGALIGANTGSGSGERMIASSIIGGVIGAGVGNAIDKNNAPAENQGGWQ
jgi:uncharacterized protein YcfJ